MSEGLLAQSSPAKEQSDWVEKEGKGELGRERGQDENEVRTRMRMRRPGIENKKSNPITQCFRNTKGEAVTGGSNKTW